MNSTIQSNKNTKPVFKIRCSAIGQIMTNPQGGSPMDKYLNQVEMIKTNQIKYDETKNKETKTAQKLRDNLQRWKYELTELEADKDRIVLSKTCQSHLEDWVKENYYGRKEQLDTKAIQKGIECENEAVFVLNQALWTSYKKSVYNNGEKMENERMTGHEDIDDTENKTIIDTKVSYTFDSFPILKEDLESNYWRQGQGYMFLKWEGYETHKVAKVLVNSPKWILEQELYRLYANLEKKYSGNLEYIEEEYNENAQRIFLGHVFDKQLKIFDNWTERQLTDEQVIPYEKRVHLFEVKRDNEAIEKIKKRVEECRLWLEQQGY